MYKISDEELAALVMVCVIFAVFMLWVFSLPQPV